MLTFTLSQLKQIACDVFRAAGAENNEAQIVADGLVRSRWAIYALMTKYR